MPASAETIHLPSSWAEYYPALRMWPEDIYAGRHLAGVGHRIPLKYLPQIGTDVVADLRFIEAIKVLR